jgi:hypothetical protein
MGSAEGDAGEVESGCRHDGHLPVPVDRCSSDQTRAFAEKIEMRFDEGFPFKADLLNARDNRPANSAAETMTRCER